MKKKIIIIVVLLAVILTLVLLPKSIYQKIFNSNNQENNETTYNLLVYLEDHNDQVVGVNVKVDELKEDEIKQKWDLLTVESSQLPEEFKSSISSLAVLENYEVEDNRLIIHTNEAIYESNGRKAMETIAWTFINDEIDEVVIYVDEEEVKHFADFTFKNITKKAGINLKYETYFLYESNATTMIYQENDLIIPVTYFHLNDDICDFIVNKTLNEEFNSESYNYTLEDSVLTLDFVDASVLTIDQISTLVESMGFNMNLNSLNINNNENPFYQRVFNEIIEE